MWALSERMVVDVWNIRFWVELMWRTSGDLELPGLETCVCEWGSGQTCYPGLFGSFLRHCAAIFDSAFLNTLRDSPVHQIVVVSVKNAFGDGAAPKSLVMPLSVALVNATLATWYSFCESLCPHRRPRGRNTLANLVC